MSSLFELHTFSDKTQLATVLNSREAVILLFDATLLPVNVRTGTDAVFISGVPNPLDYASTI